MTNAEKYKTAEERERVFDKWCNMQYRCDVCSLGGYEHCIMYWLDLEAEEEKPLPCPFCGCAIKVHAVGECRKRSQVHCTCGYRGPWCDSRDEAVAAHNRVAGKKEEK